jgi:hypothetical protein
MEHLHLPCAFCKPNFVFAYLDYVSVFGPGRALSRRVNLCCVLPNPDGDVKRIHGGLSCFGQKRPYIHREESIVFSYTEVLV